MITDIRQYVEKECRFFDISKPEKQKDMVRKCVIRTINYFYAIDTFTVEMLESDGSSIKFVVKSKEKSFELPELKLNNVLERYELRHVVDIVRHAISHISLTGEYTRHRCKCGRVASRICDHCFIPMCRFCFVDEVIHKCWHEHETCEQCNELVEVYECLDCGTIYCYECGKLCDCTDEDE